MSFKEFADLITTAFQHGWIAFASGIITLISLVLAFYNYNRKVSLKKENVAELWALFVKQQNTYSTVQAALKNYQHIYEKNLDVNTLTAISKTETFVQNVFEDIAKLIISHDVTLTEEKVDYLVNNKIISDYDRKLFNLMLNEKWSSKWWHFIPRWWRALKICF